MIIELTKGENLVVLIVIAATPIHLYFSSV